MLNFKKYLRVIKETTPVGMRFTMVLGSLIDAVTPLVQSFLAAKIINYSITSAQKNSVEGGVFICVGLLILVEVIYRLISFFIEHAQTKMGDEAEANIALAISQKASTVEYSNFEDPEFLKLSDRAEQFKFRSSFLVTQVFNSIFRPIISFLVVLVSFLAISKLAALIIIAISIPFFMFRFKLSRAERKFWNERWVERRKAEAYIDLSSERFVKESRVLGLLDYSRLTWKKLIFKINSEERVLKLKGKKLDAVESVINVAAEGMLILIVIYKIAKGELQPGYFVFAQTLITRFLSSIYSLSFGISVVDEDINLLADYIKFIELPEEPETKLKNQTKILKNPSIKVSGLSFKYPRSKLKALEDISLEISFGKDVAIVGENGAGKTTLVKLILGLYKPTEGRVEVNGNLVQDYSSSEWHKKVGVLFQDFNGFNGFKVGDAVWFGDVSKPKDQKTINKALEKAGAAKFVSKLPAGDNTYMNKWVEGDDKGAELSGGQYQRIALARAFFRDPDILILDEPTSAIDAKGEYEIFKILEEERKNKTNIFISHRFNTVRKADIIYFVESGKIIEFGSHAELVKLKGKYYELFEKYAKDFRDS